MKGKVVNYIKEVVGMGQEDNGIIGFDSEKIEKEEKSAEKISSKFFNKKENVERKQEDMSNYQSVIVDVKKVEECKKIASYIKSNKVVTLNLEFLSKEDSQRAIDFLSGAMSIKDANLVKISDHVYISVPKEINVFLDRDKK